MGNDSSTIKEDKDEECDENSQISFPGTDEEKSEDFQDTFSSITDFLPLKSVVDEAVLIHKIRKRIFDNQKNFVSDSKSFLLEQIENILIQRPLSLRRLENCPTLLLHPIPVNKVSILISTGNGNYPSFSGFIGDGMLTSVVYGGIFNFPSSDSILASIRRLSKSNMNSGCILIVRNYTINRLNCGLACEQANEEGNMTHNIVISDDCAVPRSKGGGSGSQGIVGSVLVAKISGAASQIGFSLDEVADVARMTASRIGSLSVELERGKLSKFATMHSEERRPSLYTADLDRDSVMIGVGMHGEKWGIISPFVSADYVANTLVYKIYEYGYIPFDSESKDVRLMQPGDKVAVLVNNLGGLSVHDLQVFSRCVVKYLEDQPICCKVIRLYIGTYMTSLDMRGASVSILYLDENGELIKFLDRPSDAPEWKNVDAWNPLVRRWDHDVALERPSFIDVPQIIEPKTESLEYYTRHRLKIVNFEKRACKYIRNSCEALTACRDIFDKWGLFSGNENFGSNLNFITQEILSHLTKNLLYASHPVTLFRSLKDIVSKKSISDFAFGNILIFMFDQIVCYFNSQSSSYKITERSLKNAFVKAVNSFSLYTGATQGYKTVLDALIPASKTMNSFLFFGDMNDLSSVVKKGAESTVTMHETGFRRVFQKDCQEYPHIGAVAVAVIFDAFANGSGSAINYATDLSNKY